MRTGIAGVIEKLSKRLVNLPRKRKRALMVLADAFFIPAALWSAVALKLGDWPVGNSVTPWLYLAAVMASVPIFARLGLYRVVIRFIGPRVIFAELAGVTASLLVLAAINFLIRPDGVPFTALGIYWALALVYVGGSRVVVRNLMNTRTAGTERVVIYGAGSAGAQAAAVLRVGGRFDPIAFLDDEESLQGSVVAGIEVHSPGDLKRLIREESASSVLLAMPSQPRRRRQEILKALEPNPIKVMTVPDIGDLLSGRARIQDVREVDAADLLGRDPVPPDERLFGASIRDKTVMVTGAGGSIGSELCRQIARLQPRRLVLFEVSEIALYQIDRELREIQESEKLAFHLTALLGNAQLKDRMCEIMQAYGVQTVYHAAAYKHVPIVEQNVIEGIQNNVISTWYTAEAARECGVETFVLISTDKAVNPSNVMGASKRLAEIVLQGMQQLDSRTRFCMVRFGNVLESSGSVVPLFRHQIEGGGPVTVTHPDVTRYFMTIPEASQLVLQASAMANGGDVFVLDMGQPIKIADLARRMVFLAGLTVRDEQNPDGDIEIRYTGLRPAEKLYEELLIGNNISGTEHPMIMRAMEQSLPWEKVQDILHGLQDMMRQYDVGAVYGLLRRVVYEYRPEHGVVDEVWNMRSDERRHPANVTSLDVRRGVERQKPAEPVDKLDS